MKFRFPAVLFICVLILSLMSGCSGLHTLQTRMDALENSVENTFDRVEDRVENTVRDAVVSPAPGHAQSLQELLEQSEAERIALEHAGFDAKDIKNLRTEYQIDDGVPEYHVEFRQDRWEYDYEIHAETGKILSFEKDK